MSFIKNYFIKLLSMSLITTLSYATIILFDTKKELSKENLEKLLIAAGVDIDSWILENFVSSVKILPIEKIINNFTLGSTSVEISQHVEKKQTELEDEKTEQSSEAANVFGSDSDDSDDESS